MSGSHIGIRGLFAVVLVPAILISSLFFYVIYQNERTQLEQGALQTARALSQAMDRDVAGIKGKLEVLAISESLQTGDLQAFYERCKAVLSTDELAEAIVLIDTNGQQLINTLKPYGSTLPTTANMDALRRLFASGQPVVSNGYVGAVSGRYFVSVDVPVWRDGKAVYLLRMGIPTERLNKLLLEQHLPEGWVAALLDAESTVISRTLNPSQFVGKKATPDLQAEMAKHHEGTMASRTLEGVPSFVAFSRSATTNWVVVVAMTRDVLYAKLYQPMLVVGVAILTFLFGGAFLGLWFSRRIRGSLRELRKATEAATAGDMEAMAPLSGPAEIVQLADQFNLMQRARKEAKSELRIAAAAFESHQGVVVTDANQVILRANKAFSTITGYPAEEIIGKKMGFLQSGRHDTDFYSQMWEHIKRDGSWQGEIWNRHADGDVHTYWLTISAVTGADGVITHYVGTYTDITERKKIETELQNSEETLRAITDNISTVMFMKDLSGRYLYINRQYERLFHITNSEIQGKTDYDIFPQEQAEAFVRHDQIVVRSGEPFEIEEQVQQDGRVHTYLSVKIPIRNAQGEIYAICGVATDISERKQAETDLRLAAAAFDSQEAMVITDADSVILRVNRAFTEITGYTAEEVIGKKPSLLKSNRHSADFYREMWECINRTGGWQGEVWDRRKNGEEYPKWLTISAVKGKDGVVTHYIGTHFDISERKIAEEKINELAFFDQLTNLANRTLLMDRLKQAMTASTRNESHGALLFIDLDNFKTLNDTLGHDMGDLLLKQVAQRLTACVREGDTVARLGGDEFVVMLSALSSNASDAAIAVETVAEKLLSTLQETYQLNGQMFHNTASIGITLFKGMGSTVDDLMKQADLAMYKAKDAGRNTYFFFDPHMESAVKERAALEADLRRALEEKQFMLHYQPQVVGDGRVTGAEVLVRWKHPQRGMVSPGQFIPLAEDTGLILPIGQWVLETACLQLAKWATEPGMADLVVAVNVSAHQFRQPDFVDAVLAVLDKTGADPYRLKLELTESLLVDNVQDIIEKMHALKAKGVGFSLDDFGTGYSSLSYLKKFPLDQLKIDQSFVRDVLIDPNDAAIARTVVALAQSLGLGVIAEGVETGEQRDFLASSGCHSYQGYFFSRPLPVGEFEAFVQQK
ncbi:EAL domain-containing protein [Azonexus sp. IMCC34839]|uniref:EAL domain-containing protein n=1 Tax=Azonexus sp. IMCC34839 TaxID=3133695 RepID=UPI003999BE93